MRRMSRSLQPQWRASVAISLRTIISKPKFGKTVNVETPDHIAGLMDFDNGAIVTIVTSARVARLENS